jgi:carboxypeptidase C (cathepsin A)
MVTEYAGPLYFVTIKGAGHMVPQFKPEQGFVMFERFLNEKPF